MFKLLGKKYKSLIRISLTSTIITITLLIAIASSIILNQKINNLSDNIVISVVFNKTDNEDTLKPTLNKIKQQTWISVYKYIPPDKAQEDFQKKYGEISQHLSPVNPFPPVVIINIEDAYKNPLTFTNHIKFLEHLDLVEKVNYRKDYAESVFSIYHQSLFVFISIISLVFIICFFLFYLAVRTEFKDSLDDYSAYNFFGSQKQLKPIHIKLFLIINSLLGIIIGTGIILGLWFYSKDFLNWFSIIDLQILLWSVLSIFVFLIIITFIISLFIKVKLILPSSTDSTEITE
ncbi:MAG: permease-like cell division protein FtsX [FCB group bacterium]|jgi:cell division protein FtsX